jgi:hypothetical protein
MGSLDMPQRLAGDSRIFAGPLHRVFWLPSNSACASAATTQCRYRRSRSDRLGPARTTLTINPAAMARERLSAPTRLSVGSATTRRLSVQRDGSFRATLRITRSSPPTLPIPSTSSFVSSRRQRRRPIVFAIPCETGCTTLVCPRTIAWNAHSDIHDAIGGWGFRTVGDGLR